MPEESLGNFWNELKQGHLINAGRAFPGSDMAAAALVGRAGPFAGIPAALAAVTNPGGDPGSLGERFDTARDRLRGPVERNPISALVGGVTSPYSLPGVKTAKTAGGLAKTGAGALNGALNGGAQSWGLGAGVAPGAIAGGVVGGLAGAIGAGLAGAGKSETLDPTLNRLKYLKPSNEEAQPLSESGSNLREAIKSTSADGQTWKGAPSRETMIERLQSQQAPEGKKIGDFLNKADTANQSLPRPVNPMEGEPFAKSDATLQDLLDNAHSSGDNPDRLKAVVAEQKANFAKSTGSLDAMNKAKQGIYRQTYNPNTSDMGERYLSGRDKLLRSMGRDVKNSIQGTVDKIAERQRVPPTSLGANDATGVVDLSKPVSDFQNINQIDPSVLRNANKQYGTLQTLLEPLNRAIGKEMGEHSGGRVNLSPTHAGASMFADALNLGGRRYLGQAHLGEMLQGAGKAIPKFMDQATIAPGAVARGGSTIATMLAGKKTDDLASYSDPSQVTKDFLADHVPKEEEQQP
ncbi:MAG: hypothetical protein V4563_16975 [Pseudomonadota bacterium]